MADPATAQPEGLDPFGGILSGQEAVPAIQTGEQKPEGQDPFAELLQPAPETQTSTTGAFLRSAERNTLPAAGGLAAAGAGAELGAALGAPFGGVGAIPGALIGGIGGALGGSYLVGKAQDWALKELPDSWQEALGQDDRQQKLDQEYHGTASFIGGLLPYALTMKPGFSLASKALPENATAFQRLMANPATAKGLSGAVMGGMELGNETVHGQKPNWTNIAIATGFGMLFNKPTAIGEKITELGAAPTRRALGIESPTIEADNQPTIQNNSQAVVNDVAGGVPGPDNGKTVTVLRPAKNGNGYIVRDEQGQERFMGSHLLKAVPNEPVPTVAQAGDAKVMGPGITEEVFQGSHSQAPETEMTAQDQARTEQSVIGEQPEGPSVHDVARRIEPETFQEYDRLAAQREELRARLAQVAQPSDEDLQAVQQQRDEFQQQLDQHIQERGGYVGGPEARRLRAQIRDRQAEMDEMAARREAFAQGNGADTPEMAALRQQIMATDFAMRDMTPQVSAAYRRAADAIGSGTVPPEIPAEAPTEAEAQPTSEQPSEPGPSDTQLPPEQQAAFIAQDVARQLLEAGRPEEEARASGKLVAQRYATRAALLNGRLGSPLDLYMHEAPEVRAGVNANAPMEQKEFAQSTPVQDFSDQELGRVATAIAKRLGAKKTGQGLTYEHLSGDRLKRSRYYRLPNGRELRISDHNRGTTAHINLVLDPESGEAVIETTDGMSPRTLTSDEFHRDDDEVLTDADGKPYEDEHVFGGDGEAWSNAIMDRLAELSAPAQKAPIQTDDQRLFEQAKRGAITFKEGRKPLIKLFQDANASTFIHETGHAWLEELMRDAAHPQAPDALKADAQTVRDWLKAEGETIKRGQHEKFARGFEQYMREGIAPSQGLARVFSQFRNWLTTIYQTLKGLGQPINDDIRGVFDRMLAEEPQRTVIAPETEAARSLASLHEQEAREVEPAEAEPAMDRVVSERDRFIAEQPQPVQSELATADTPTESGSGEGESGEVVADSGQSEPVAPSSGGGGIGSEINSSSSEAGAEGARLPTGAGSAAGTDAANGPGEQRPVSGEHSRANPLSPNPGTIFGPEESQFLDKAGNIRLDTLTNDEDIRQALRDAANENNDFIGDRRGVVTDGQIMDLADDIGMGGALGLVKRRVVGQAFNAEQVVALRKLLRTSAQNVSDLMRKAAEGNDADVMAYAQARARHQLIQGTVAGVTAEAGRALRAFRNIAGTETGEGLEQFIRTATGRTLFQLREEAKLGSKLDTPEKVTKYLRDAQKRSFGRMLLEYFVNNLISGPITHTTYAIGNTIMSLENATLETGAAATIGAIRRAAGRQGERIHFGEVGAQLRGAWHGLPAGIEAGIEGLRSGATTLLPGEEGRPNIPLFGDQSLMVGKQATNAEVKWSEAASAGFGLIRGIRDGILSTGKLVAMGGEPGSALLGVRYSPAGAIPDITLRGANVLPLGNTIRLPGRFVASIHSFFRAVNYSMEKNALAYRMATDEGLHGDAFDQRIADIRQNPSEELMEKARGEATERTLMGHGSELIRRISAVTNWETDLPIFGETRPLKFIDPFVHIAGNIIDQAIVQRTPVGILSPEIRADLLGKNGNVAQDTAQARMLVGTLLSIGFGSLAAEGLISGSEPEDPREAAVWRMAGNQPYSVRIGNMWYATHKLGPLGLLMGTAADAEHLGSVVDSGDMVKAAHTLTHAFAQNILDESFMRGPSELIQALEDPGRYGESFIRNFIGSWVPFSVGMAQIARSTDPYSRQARTVMDEVKSKVPGMSESLFPRRDIWGEPLPSYQGLGTMTAIYEQKVNSDPVNHALLNAGYFPAQVQRRIRNVQLTDQEYDDYARLAGRMAKQRLDVVVNSPDWKTWPVNVQHDRLKAEIDLSREVARNVMMAKYPDIARQATALKRARLH